MTRVYTGRISLAAIGASLLLVILLGVSGSAVAQTPGSAGGSPTMVRDASSGFQWLYYVGADRSLWTWAWQGSKGWDANYSLGGEPVAAGSSPTMVREASSGFQWLYYVGADGHVWTWAWQGSRGWDANYSLGGEPAAAGTSPTMVRDASSGFQWLYYVGADRSLWTWAWQGASGWDLNARLPSAVPPPPVQTTPVPTPLPRPRARHALHVKVVLTWTWRYKVTRLAKVRIGSFPGHMRLTFRCRGRGCPRARPASAAGSRRVRRMLRAWQGRRFHAGDRLLITLTAPGYLPERAALVMRSANTPRVRLL